MTIDKAIEIVSDSCYRGVTTFNQDFKDAQKLLIEAGKAVINARANNYYTPIAPLPGETKE